MKGFRRVTLALAVAAALISVPALVAVARQRERRRRSVESERARLLAGSLPYMVWGATARGTMDYCNQRFAQYTGLAADALKPAGLKHAQQLRLQIDAQIADGGGARPTADGGDAAKAAGSEPGATDSGAGESAAPKA